MDLVPPLVQSSVCTPKTYCRSESSTITDCPPSPDLVATAHHQHYSISSLYDFGISCSMASPYHDHSVVGGAASSSTSLSGRLDQESQQQPEWKWHPAVVLHPAVTSASAMSGNITAEYDPFPSYDGGTFSQYSQYPPPTAVPGSRSPALSTSSSRLHQREEHARPGGYSQYPSPSIAHTSYPPPPVLNDPYETEWSKDRYVIESDAHSNSTGLVHPTMLAHDAQLGPSSSSSRNPPSKRTPRRLTTKEDANFECAVEGCGKLFSRSYNYKAHLETHREKRNYPFPCQEQDCNKKFVRKTDLRRHHQSVHMKERNYKCEFCGRGFSRRDTLGR